MMHAIHSWLVVIALSGVVSASATGSCAAGDQPAPSGPKPIAELPPEAFGAQSSATSTSDRPPAYILPPPPNYTVIDEDWIRSPLLERPEAAPPGPFFNVESSVLWPHFSNHLKGGRAPNFNVGGPATGGLPITGDIVKFPGNRLNATVSPRFEVGYRFPDGFGELYLSYRLMDSRGSDTVFGANDDLGLAAQTGRLGLNFIDLDFGTRQVWLGPDWEMRTAVGFRFATAFVDSQVSFLNPITVVGSPFGTDPFTRLTQTEVIHNRYFGAHAVLEAGRKV